MNAFERDLKNLKELHKSVIALAASMNRAHGKSNSWQGEHYLTASENLSVALSEFEIAVGGEITDRE